MGNKTNDFCTTGGNICLEKYISDVELRHKQDPSVNAEMASKYLKMKMESFTNCLSLVPLSL